MRTNSTEHRLTAVLLLVAGAALASPGASQDPVDALAATKFSPWRVLGPFGAKPNQGFRTEFVRPDRMTGGSPQMAQAVQNSAGKALHWRLPKSALTDGRIHHLDRFDVGEWDSIYLHRTATAKTAQQINFLIGMDDAIKLWVNGRLTFSRDTSHAVRKDQYPVPASLRQGQNDILLKISNKRSGAGFYFRAETPTDGTHKWGGGLPDDEHTSYEVSSVPIPDDIVLEVGGLLFLPDRSLLVCCRRGQVFRIENPAETDPAKLRMTVFADGLHEPLGMLLDDDGSLLVAQKPELTRLRDRDGDGRADSYETVVDNWGLSGNYHEYTFGPVRDGNGDLWCTLNIGFPSGTGPARIHRGSAFRVTPSGKFEITAMGLRSPNGLVVNDDGDVFYTDNQGEWMDVCRLSHLQPKKNYGHPVSFEWAHKMPDFGWGEQRTLPAVWYPYSLARSTSWPAIDRTKGKFGPYAGQMFVGDQNNSLIVRTTLEKVGGVWQGACYPFWQRFAGGINRLAFDADGTLYAGLTNRGWGSVGAKGHGLQRIRYTGEPPFDLLEVTATAEGFQLEFTKPLAADTSLHPKRFYVREYGYRYFSRYGSPEVDSRDIEITKVTPSADRRSVHLHTGKRTLHRAFEITIRGKLRSIDDERPLTQQAFYTLHALPKR